MSVSELGENASIVGIVIALVIGTVVIAVVGRGCYVAEQQKDIEQSANRAKVMEACVSSHRQTSECEDLLRSGL